jgi:hypothetical protein
MPAVTDDRHDRPLDYASPKQPSARTLGAELRVALVLFIGIAAFAVAAYLSLEFLSRLF